MKSSAIISCMTAALLGAASIAPMSANAAEPLRLCADPTNAPFSTKSTEAVKAGMPGLYVEIGQAVADALGRPFEVEWSLSYFGKRNISTTMLAGQCDFAVGLPAVDDFMGPRVVFSKPILEIGYALVLPAGRQVASTRDLAGLKVAVQYSTPPQSLLATKDNVTIATVMNPEEGIAKLVKGEVDAAFIWGPSAGFANHTELHDSYRVIPVEGASMHFPAAIGFSKKNAALRDQVDAILPSLAPKIAELATKYALPHGQRVQLTTAAVHTHHFAPVLQAAYQPGIAGPDNTGDVKLMLAAAEGGPKGPPGPLPANTANVAEGREIFNGTCSHCHGPDGVQSVRKINLRLLLHRYGDDTWNIYHTTVTQGRPAKGMPTWEGVFTEDDFSKIYTFLSTVQEDN